MEREWQRERGQTEGQKGDWELIDCFERTFCHALPLPYIYMYIYNQLVNGT